MEIRREPFVSSKDFLKSARGLGITVLEGVCEIIDNSLDADAHNIWISIEKKDNGNFRFIFCDDGNGIPKTHADTKGEVHQGIPYVLTYGGRIPNPFKPAPIGKFGFGLSQTSSCLSSRTEVYSKTEDDATWRHSYYDFDEFMDENSILLPIETESQPPWLNLPETGTIVVMENVDRADYVRGDAIVAMLLKNLGRVYRMFLANGTNITISHGKTEKTVRINDPLVVLEASEEVQHLGGHSRDYGEIVLTFDKANPMGEIIDPQTGEPAECAFVFRRLSVEAVRTALKLPLVGSVGDTKVMGKWNINARGQGFSVLRNGREIRSGETLGVFTTHPEYNFFRGQVAFSEALDGLFNVKTNKSRFSINNDFRKYLIDTIGEKVDQIKADYKEELSNLNAKKERPVVPIAEIIAADVKHMLPKPRLTDKAREAGKKAEQAVVQALIKKVENEQASKIAKAQSLVKMAENSGDTSAIATAELNLKVTADAAAKAITSVMERFAFDSNCRKFADAIGTGGLFEIKAHGDHAHVIINTETEFYNRVYSLAEKDADLESMLDLMIFSIAWSEHVDAPEQKHNWEHIRREISAQAEIFVGSMADLVEGGEV